MLTLLTTNNSALLRQIANASFERAGVTPIVAESAEQALDLARKHHPRIAVLDADRPDLDGFDLCRRMKEDPELRRTRIMLVFEGVLDRPRLLRLQRASCDDLFSLPAPFGELYQHVARLCGLPARASRRIALELRAELESGATPIHGRVVNLSREGARVELDQPFTARELRMRLSRSDHERAAFVRARVVRADPFGIGVALGLAFSELSPEVRAIVDDLALWDVVDTDLGQQVLLQGDFTERTDFGSLLSNLASGTGPVEIDLSAVRYMNSSGVRNWITFLRRLEGQRKGSPIGFVRCSVGFISQAGMAPEVLGGAQVVSLWAPYHCDACNQSEERLLQVAALLQPIDAEPAEAAPVGANVVFPAGRGVRVEPPRFSCGSCPGELVFDELPERYFAFLSATG